MKILQQNVIIVLLFMALFMVSGCKSKSSFLTDKQFNKFLLGSWEVVNTSNVPYSDEWHFLDKNKLVMIRKVNNLPPDTSGVGTYSPDARMWKTSLFIKGFDWDALNGRWQVLLGRGEKLTITIPYKDCNGQPKCGLLQKEFVKLR